MMMMMMQQQWPSAVSSLLPVCVSERAALQEPAGLLLQREVSALRRPVSGHIWIQYVPDSPVNSGTQSSYLISLQNLNMCLLNSCTLLLTSPPLPLSPSSSSCLPAPPQRRRLLLKSVLKTSTAKEIASATVATTTMATRSVRAGNTHTHTLLLFASLMLGSHHATFEEVTWLYRSHDTRER